MVCGAACGVGHSVRLPRGLTAEAASNRLGAGGSQSSSCVQGLVE